MGVYENRGPLNRPSPQKDASNVESQDYGQRPRSRTPPGAVCRFVGIRVKGLGFRVLLNLGSDYNSL